MLELNKNGSGIIDVRNVRVGLGYGLINGQGLGDWYGHISGNGSSAAGADIDEGMNGHSFSTEWEGVLCQI